MNFLDCGGTPLDLSHPRVMGILNVTPDSFSDGGSFVTCEAALARARCMVEEGADIIDVGGESTRPGAEPVSERKEIDRVVPIVEALAAELPVPISVDTSKPGVMAAAARAGAGMINDVLALRAPGALDVVADSGLPVCLMHMRGMPRTMQEAPFYRDVVADVLEFLETRVEACERAAIPRERLLVDPGIGFGKTLKHNLRLLKNIDGFLALNLPVLVGVSRKSMIGAVLGKAVDDRLYGSIAAALLAVQGGVHIVRVHDVGPTVDALRVARAVWESE